MKPPRTYPSLKRLAKAWKRPPFFDQGPVIARLHDLPLPQHDNPVSVYDGGNTVGDNHDDHLPPQGARRVLRRCSALTCIIGKLKSTALAEIADRSYLGFNSS